MSDYETDTLLWSERQVDLLRRLAAGERVNDRVDWGNVAEEIDSVGRSQRIALELLSYDAEAVPGGFFPAEPHTSA